MRILALDHGSARIGCAVCDPTGVLVRPLEVIEPADAKAAATLAKRLDAELILVGLPRTLSGQDGHQAAIVREFCRELAELVEIPVRTYDERLTTRMAQQTRNQGARAAEDSIAAAHLLESYLTRQGSEP